MEIAIVEDDFIIREYLKNLLLKEGWIPLLFDSGEKFLKNAAKKIFNIVIVDINLDKISGYDLIRTIRKYPEKYGDPKFLILSSRIEQDDVNKGLILGADDYLKKPFDDTELLLRLEKIIRSKASIPLEKIKYKELIINFSQCKVFHNGTEYSITKRECDVLKFLIENVGLVINKRKLFYEIWGESYIPGSKTLEVCLHRLRKKIPFLKDNIITYKELGYKLKL